MRNFFGRRRSGRSSTRRGGIFGESIERALIVLILVTLILILLRVSGLI